MQKQCQNCKTPMCGQFCGKSYLFAQFSKKMVKSHLLVKLSDSSKIKLSVFRDVLGICVIQLFSSMSVNDYGNFGVIDDVKSSGTLIEG